MYFTIFIYYIIYVNFILGLIPADALFYLRPAFLLILTILFVLPTILIKKKFLPIFIFIINIGFSFILCEFARVTTNTSIIIIIITTIILLLIYIKNKITHVIGYILLFCFLTIALWQGTKIQYKSNLEYKSIDTMDINFFTYGENGDIPTYSIDSSNYYNGNSGLAGWYDKVYWKLSTDLPLNGRVFYPKTPGQYPLIVVVHGNHLAENASQFGYDYLLQNFANNGYIAISIDQNFLNGNWTTLGMGLPKENDARGYLILEHLKLLQQWNKDKSSKLYNMINMDNIGLIGHSRGGEAISIAASKGPEYNIKALMALSPTDRQFRENIYLENKSYITLHGANDGDLIKFKGRGQYNRTSFNNDIFNFKASYYIEGLNHVQFNSDWGEIDSAGLGKLFYGSNLNVNSIDQMEISKEIGLVFFDIVLKGKVEQLSKIKNPHEIKTLPSIRYITDYNDSNTIIIYDFQNELSEKEVSWENIEKNYIYRRYNRSLQIDGDKGSSISFVNKFSNNTMSKINISLASNKYKDQEILLKLISNNKTIDTFTINLKKALKKNTFKTDFFQINENTIEAHFQQFTIPVTKWDSLEIELDSDESSVIIDNINYS